MEAALLTLKDFTEFEELVKNTAFNLYRQGAIGGGLGDEVNKAFTQFHKHLDKVL